MRLARCGGEGGDGDYWVREICYEHPMLSKTKLIAEPWETGMYQVRGCVCWG